MRLERYHGAGTRVNAPSDKRLVSAPAVVIRLELERSPVVCLDCLNEDDQVRLVDWIEAHPRYRAIVAAARALELEARERAA